MNKIIIKNPEQIEGVRKSCQLAAKTLNFLSEHIKEGISTKKLDELAEEYMRDHYAIPATKGYKGYPASICTSLNEVICHGIPDQTVLKNGDIINIDVTTILNGYYGDTSRMFAIGEISKEASDLLQITQECLALAIEQVKPDASFGEISKTITNHAENHRYSVVYQFCGHGTGIEFHEPPMINHCDRFKLVQTKMRPGMIFTIEPMINIGFPTAKILADGWTAKTIDGQLSAQYEHTILVTQDGYEILTI